MLRLTPKATNHLITVRKERGVDDQAGARFISKGGRVGLTFAAAPTEGDRVVDGEKINVFVAADIAEALDQSIIDASDQNGRMSLVIRRRPPATA
jgi:Fe-S cluster assembly iron-binding protein IscA